MRYVRQRIERLQRMAQKYRIDSLASEPVYSILAQRNPHGEFATVVTHVNGETLNERIRVRTRQESAICRNRSGSNEEGKQDEWIQTLLSNTGMVGGFAAVRFAGRMR